MKIWIHRYKFGKTERIRLLRLMTLEDLENYPSFRRTKFMAYFVSDGLVNPWIPACVTKEKIAKLPSVEV